MTKIDIKKFIDIPFAKRARCVVCETPFKKPLISLPDFPLTEIYTRRPLKKRAGYLDQEFHFCENCGQGQLAHVIDKDLLYGESFSYHFRTSESLTGRDSSLFFVNFLDRVVGKKRFKTIVEVGCNDLHLLRSISDRAEKLIGIDPILKGREKEWSRGKIVAVGDFLENIDLENDIDLVICKDTLEHVVDPKGFIQKILRKGHEDTLYFFQFPFLETLCDGMRFDQIFHQHLNYFSLKSILKMLDELGCELLDHTINHNLWGSILIVFKKGRNSVKYRRSAKKLSSKEILRKYGVFQQTMDLAQKRLEEFAGTVVYGYGAALMLPVLSYHLKNDFSGLKAILDDDQRKAGLYYINLPVKIIRRDQIADFRNAVVLITAIATFDNVRRILKNVFELNPKQIIVPMNVF